MISKKEILFISQLNRKKFRDKYQCFVAEGSKCIHELSQNFQIKLLLGTDVFFDKFPATNSYSRKISYESLKKISFLNSPQDALAIFSIPTSTPLESLIIDDLTLVLDGIQDPGNFGTIIRTANWFGVKNIICSPDCVDKYSPKVVQATMGTLGTCNIYYTDLSSFLRNQKLPIIGTVLNGQSLYNCSIPNKTILVMGNEGKGISPNLQNLLHKKILIPPYQESKNITDSLNVAIATAILFSEIRKNKA